MMVIIVIIITLLTYLLFCLFKNYCFLLLFPLSLFLIYFKYPFTKTYNCYQLMLKIPTFQDYFEISIYK